MNKRDLERAKRGGLSKARNWATSTVEYEPCPVCGRKMPVGRYICSRCEIHGVTGDPSRIVDDEPEFAKATRDGCDACPNLHLCKMRLILDPCAWVLCEIPDQFDLATASDEAVRGWREVREYQRSRKNRIRH